ncbi:hypothetical protein Nepgr_012417 [Nepenthes gracilis]|uniref:Uncharacterized protein n=1 Tax=Nepenthes gracilis TaxID=150966 RepID=A0AAD3XNA9_NEPGR|nr:hypothetical protein Nepgr_012417 [Nepenthes gracilis]
MSSCVSRSPLISAEPMNSHFFTPRAQRTGVALVVLRSVGFRACKVRASTLDSHETPSDFGKRMEQAWIISQVSAVSVSLTYWYSLFSFLFSPSAELQILFYAISA